MADAAIIDDADTHHYQQPRQHRIGYELHQAGSAEQHGEQEQAVKTPESRVRPPALMLTTVRVVAPEPGMPPTRAGGDIPDTLSDQFPVAAVLRLGDVVRHH